MNSHQAKMLATLLLALDESMSGWRPKTSKLGDLLNCTWEPRKPALLGRMFRNGVEGVSGILVHQDVIQNPEQELKSISWRKVVSPWKPMLITAHAAEVLRQVDGANVPRRWMGWWRCLVWWHDDVGD
jgi:hypothetical protein